MYKIRSYDTLINEAYERISKGMPFDKDFKPYNKKFIGVMISYFEEREYFEKCQTLKKFEENLDHERNYTQWTQKI